MTESAMAFERFEDEQEENGWKIENDQEAEWAINRIKEAENDLDKWTRYYNLMIERIKNTTEHTTAVMRDKLQAYFQTVPHTESKTQEKYSLPSGDLVMKKAKTTWVHDDDALMQWCDSNGFSECVKVKRSISWADVKKRLTEDSNGVICDAETGVVCDAVRAEVVEPTFTVNISK